MRKLQSLRTAVLKTSLELMREGLVRGSQGNVSARDAESGLIAVTPSAMPYNDLQVEDICIVDLQGNMVDCLWKPTSELLLHLAIYQQRPDIHAVIHSHAPYASVFAVAREPLSIALSESAMVLGANLPLAPYAPPGSAELANITANSLRDVMGAIMANHGLITVGTDLNQALQASLAAESNARAVILARAMGKKEATLDSSEVASLHETYLLTYRPQKP